MEVSLIKIVGLLTLYAFLVSTTPAWAANRYYNFVINRSPYTRLCSTKSILTVNGQFPGPTITARRGDFVYVNVRNQGGKNITLHWHGVHQPRNPWSDGPEYVTQCPISPGGQMTYRVQITEEEGTIWWHAHSDWDRATVHGAIVIYPKIGDSLPFPKPDKDLPIIIGQWWKSDPDQVIADALRTGAAPNISDAYTINGQPGDMYNCSKPETYKFQVEQGKTYLLRVINAAMNNEMFFAVAGHNLTVVGTDAAYTKPFTVNYIMITPGQSMDVLLQANASPSRRYYMAARSYWSASGIAFDPSTTTGIVEYQSNDSDPSNTTSSNTPLLPFLPETNDTAAATSFTDRLRSLNSAAHPAKVPQTIDRRIIMSVSVNLERCANTTTGPCMGPLGQRLSASLNNISFANPTISVLQAYYNNISGVYGEGFPDRPPIPFDYTGVNNFDQTLVFTEKKTEVKVLDYNTSVEIVWQDTNLVVAENHPMHLHGQSFYVVGRGFGNFDENTDPANYNLVDPPYHNTVGVPVQGWAAVRFRTLNPGVWFLHCHLDVHLSWGMNTAFIVKNGPTKQTSLLPPPPDMPPC